MLKGLPTVGQTKDMRELVVDYVKGTGAISVQADGNWKIVPAEAVAAMEMQADKAGSTGR
jgi:hypothetical protein